MNSLTTQMLGLIDKDFKVTMTYMLKNVPEKKDIMSKEGGFSVEI